MTESEPRTAAEQIKFLGIGKLLWTRAEYREPRTQNRDTDEMGILLSLSPSIALLQFQLHLSWQTKTKFTKAKINDMS